jgi:hypothetical protein
LRIEGEAESTAVASGPILPPSGRDQPAGSIEVAIGQARVRVEGAVDPEVLRQMRPVRETLLLRKSSTALASGACSHRSQPWLFLPPELRRHEPRG